MRTLLMGGQACVFYGAAEFSRDLDLLILQEPENIAKLTAALDDLEAVPIAVPLFDPEFLQRGHALHFRCQRSDVAKLRIDVMANLRGVDTFEQLWERRTTIETGTEQVDILSLGDLVTAKKTQRDKDWPMIARLVERSYFDPAHNGSAELIRFWLMELRSPELLMEAAGRFRAEANQLKSERPALHHALKQDPEGTAQELSVEEQSERAKDREYWEPLKRELERLRHSTRHTS